MVARHIILDMLNVGLMILMTSTLTACVVIVVVVQQNAETSMFRPCGILYPFLANNTTGIHLTVVNRI